MAVNSQWQSEVLPQLEQLRLQAGRPLIVTDADEVLFAFMAGFEGYLQSQGLYFDWRSFALTGNIRERDSDLPIEGARVQSLLLAFFEAHTEALQPVPGAAAGLARLATRSQIVVLSNLPLANRAARQRALVAQGMDYPLVANIGTKGEAVRHLEQMVRAPVFFIDDIPRNHTSVRQAVETALCLHFVADPRLAELLGPAEHSHHRADNWPAAVSYIEERLAELGY